MMWFSRPAVIAQGLQRGWTSELNPGLTSRGAHPGVYIGRGRESRIIPCPRSVLPVVAERVAAPAIVAESSFVQFGESSLMILDFSGARRLRKAARSG